MRDIVFRVESQDFQPHFSVVLLAHNRPEGLKRLLKSIAECDYNLKALEIIVIDDGSHMDLESIARSFEPTLRIIYQKIKHSGVSAARNKGLQLSSFPFICFLADDYALAKDYFKNAERFFHNYPEASLVTFNVKSSGKSWARHLQQSYCDFVLRFNAKSLPDKNGVIKTESLPASRAAIFRREVFELVGNFNENLQAGEDGELSQRLKAKRISLYFLPNYYIEHWENKNFKDFLRQREDYARSFYAVSRLNPKASLNTSPIWTYSKILSVIFDRLGAWRQLSHKSHLVMRYYFWLPGLFLFLWKFYSTLRSCEKIDLAQHSQDGKSLDADTKDLVHL